MFQIHDGDLPAHVYEALLAQPTIACDTETSGLDWVNDRLALVQLHSAKTQTHMVRVTRDSPGHFVCRILEAQSVRKVFHHAPFDLAFLKATWGVDAQNVACTKVASKLLYRDGPVSHSLQPLLERTLGVHVVKGAVRTSDWESARLTREQLDYAHSDVAFLIPLLKSLEKSLGTIGMLELFQQCCDFLPVRARTDQLQLSDIFSY